MSVPAQLSRQIQEAISREAADGLLDWMTTMDQQRADLRELNELNAARFEARLGERTAELRQAMQTGFARVDGGFAAVRQEMHGGLADVRQEMRDGLAGVRQELRDGLAGVRREIQAVDSAVRLEIAELRRDMQAGDAGLRQEMHVGFGRIEALIERSRADLMKWALGFGVGVTGAATGLVLVIERLLG